eukprot:1474966-Pyramimonas_sp.AAC.1
MKGAMLKPSPPMCADMVATLVAAKHDYDYNSNQVEMYTMVHKIKMVFGSTPSSTGDLPQLRVWPESPRELPSAVFAS